MANTETKKARLRKEQRAKQAAERRAEKAAEEAATKDESDKQAGQADASAENAAGADKTTVLDEAAEEAAAGNGKAAAAGKPGKAAKAAQGKKKAKRALTKTGKIVLVAIGVLAMVLSVTAMAFSGILNEVTGANKTETYTLTGGVAATVNGVNITEDTVTKQIMSTRTSGGYTKDSDWAAYLSNQGLTPETMRKQVIDSYAQQYLLEQAVKERNITVSTQDVQDAWDKAAKQYGGEDSMKNLIKLMGYTEDTYKQSLEESLAQDKLKEEVAPAKTPSDDEILTYFNDNLDTYNDARRSENLLIKVDSSASDDDKAKAKEKAQGILDRINKGELSFEDAVSQYSEDTGSKDKKGDVGWDKLTSFVTEYQTALTGLQKDQISGVVETTYGYHIIKCTDYFHVDGKAEKIDQLPSEFKDYISNVVKTQNQTDAYNTWLEDYTKKADIKINKMPDNVPYNVDMDKASEATSADSGSAGVAQPTTDSGSGSADSGSEAAADNTADAGAASAGSTGSTGSGESLTDATAAGK